METDKLLEKIYNLQTESCERDARLETQMTEFSKRMDKTESLLERLGDVLTEHKHLSSAVDALNLQIGEIKEDVKKNSDAIKELKTAPAKTVYESIKKIIWIAVPIFVSAICTAIIAWIKK